MYANSGFLEILRGVILLIVLYVLRLLRFLENCQNAVGIWSFHI